MAEAARKKKKTAVIVVRKPKRTGRKQVATTTSPPTSTPTTCLTPPINQQLPFRTRSQLQIDQPPRYSVLFPPEQINIARRPLPSLHPPPQITPETSSPSSVIDNGLTPTPIRPVIHPERPVDDAFFEQQRPSPDAIAHEALRDLISTKFDSVITSIDGEQFGGDEQELFIQDDVQSGIRGGWGFGSRQVSRGANRAISTAVIGTNYFAKVNLYANSKLPPNLPPLQL